MVYSSQRSQWGAKGNGGSTLRGPLPEVVIHTEAGPDLSPNSSRAQEMARMKAIDAFHLSLGWSGGFGYSAGMNPRSEAGRVHEGRGYLKSGAHTQGRNRTAHAVVMLGHGDRYPMTSGAIRGCRRWIGEGVARGSIANKPNISGHRDYSTKSCPGHKIYPQLSKLRGVTSLDRHSPTEPPKDYELGDRTLRLTDPYMQGPDVREWQRLLDAWRRRLPDFNTRYAAEDLPNGVPLLIDGIFGGNTRAETTRFMRSVMDVDTVDPRVGPKTIAEMRTWLATDKDDDEEEDEMAHLSDDAQKALERMHRDGTLDFTERMAEDLRKRDARPTSLGNLLEWFRAAITQYRS